jgi:hypothetical protein
MVFLRNNPYGNSDQPTNGLHVDYEANVNNYFYQVKEKLKGKKQDRKAACGLAGSY